MIIKAFRDGCRAISDSGGRLSLILRYLKAKHLTCCVFARIQSILIGYSRTEGSIIGKMPMDFATFVVQLNDAILFENGPNLAYLLRPTSPHGKDLVKEFRNPTVRPCRN
jgi:hypothetical protein